MEPRKLAADLFDELADATHDGVGITRASYGEGEAFRARSRGARSAGARPRSGNRPGLQHLHDARRRGPGGSPGHNRLAPRLGCRGWQFRRRCGRRRRSGGHRVALAAGNRSAVRHPRHGHSRGGERLVRHVLYRQPGGAGRPAAGRHGNRQTGRYGALARRAYAGERAATRTRSTRPSSMRSGCIPFWKSTSSRVRFWSSRACRSASSPAYAATAACRRRAASAPTAIAAACRGARGRMR